METVTFKANKKKTKVIKQLLKAMDISFQSEDEKIEYHPELVEKLNRGLKEVETGNCKKIKLDDLWS